MEKHHVVKPEDFGVSKNRGFLPNPDPLRKLPHDFAYLDDLGSKIPDALGSGTMRKLVRELPSLPRPLTTLAPEAQKLVMLRASFAASAFRYETAHLAFAPPKVRERILLEEEIVIPRNLARILVETANALGVPPILSYSFYCLVNWERLEGAGPIALGNLKLLQHFLGGLDERHFILIHTEIERNLGPAVYSLPEIQEAVAEDNIRKVTELLESLAQDELNAVATMERMVEACHPDVYYLRVRPYIFGFNIRGSPARVIFEGLEQQMPVLRGETGAQTPSWPTLWAALGIQFSDDALKYHVLEMRNYLLPAHRAFLEAIEQGPSIRQCALSCLAENRRGSRRLRDAYNIAIWTMYRFFRIHLHFAEIYIDQKGKKYRLHKDQGKYGTGGTPFIPYLKQHCKEILAHRIP